MVKVTSSVIMLTSECLESRYRVITLRVLSTVMRLLPFKLTILGGADELRERFAPDDCGVVLRHVHRRRHCDDEVLEGLHVSQANRTSLDLEKVLPRVDELWRQVKLVVRPRREPAGQRHRRRADGHRPFAPVQQVASPQVLA